MFRLYRILQRRAGSKPAARLRPIGNLHLILVLPVSSGVQARVRNSGLMLPATRNGMHLDRVRIISRTEMSHSTASTNCEIRWAENPFSAQSCENGFTHERLCSHEREYGNTLVAPRHTVTAPLQPRHGSRRLMHHGNENDNR